MTVAWWLGDSIGTGGWLEPTARLDCPPGRINSRCSRPAIINASRGGLALHSPDGRSEVAQTYLPMLMDGYGVPDVLVIALGANDIGSHGVGMWDSKYALNRLINTARSRGVDRVIVQQILPVTAGEECTEPLPPGLPRQVVPGAFVPELTARIRDWNQWVIDSWNGQDDVLHVGGILRENTAGKGNPDLYLDGLHPNRHGSILIGDSMHHQLRSKGVI